MPKYLFISFVLTLIPLLGACGSGSEKSAASLNIVSEDAYDLPLPSVPDSLQSVESRAAFVALHYWDAMDFRNPTAVDTAFVEQNISNFISLLAVAPREAAAKSVADLLRRAAPFPEAFSLLNHAAERYLDDPNSPMRNEETYILFLEALANADYLPAEEKLRPQLRLREALKNRPGSIAADFRGRLRDGRETSLHTLTHRADTTLMIFYDPDCEHCSEVIAAMSATPPRQGWQILAVDYTGDYDRWLRSAQKIPAAWTDIFALTPEIDGNLYSIPASPVVYLLLPDSRVLLKDPPLN